MTAIAGRVAAVLERIEKAVQHRGPGTPVRLVGVSKYQPVEAIAAAFRAGLHDFGENYAQELRGKRAALDSPALRWHFVGPVQTNKVKYVVGTACIHTVDRLDLLRAIERRAASQGLQQDVLVQVNIAGEVSKHGCARAEVPALLDRFSALEHVRCRGLMLIPPEGDAASTRTHFQALRQLRDELAAQSRPRVDLGELSMGMSADFELAIAEGATLVRVGTAVFGPRPSNST